MGCGASKKDVVETGERAKSPPPEKKPAAEAKPTTPPPQAEASKPAIPDDKHNHQDVPAGEAPANNNPPPAQPQEAPKPAESHPPAAQPAPSSPSQQPKVKDEKEHKEDKEHKEKEKENKEKDPKEQHSQPAASAALPPAGPSDHKKPAEEKEKEKKDKEKDKEGKHEENKEVKEKSKTDFHLPALTPKKGALVEIDLGSNSVPPSPSSKSAVQERLERYAEDRKGVGALRPSSASLERRMAEADSRRKQQADQKVKKAKYTNELAKDKYSELREAEEKKTQELLQLIKNKNAQAATKRNQMQQEVKAKAEEDVSKARELSAKRREGGSAPQTPHSNASDSAPVSARSEEDEKSLNSKDKEKSILEMPLPPLK